MQNAKLLTDMSTRNSSDVGSENTSKFEEDTTLPEKDSDYSSSENSSDSELDYGRIADLKRE